MRNVCIIIDQESMINISVIFCHILTIIIVFILMWRISKCSTFDTKRNLLKNDHLIIFELIWKYFSTRTLKYFFKLWSKSFIILKLKFEYFWFWNKNYRNTASKINLLMWSVSLITIFTYDCDWENTIRTKNQIIFNDQIVVKIRIWKILLLIKNIFHYLEGVIVKTSKVLIYWCNLIEKDILCFEILSRISNSVLIILEEYLFEKKSNSLSYQWLKIWNKQFLWKSWSRFCRTVSSTSRDTVYQNSYFSSFFLRFFYFVIIFDVERITYRHFDQIFIMTISYNLSWR